MITRRKALATLAAVPVVALTTEAAAKGISGQQAHIERPPFAESLDLECVAPSFDVRRLTPALREQIWANRAHCGPVLSEDIGWAERNAFFAMCRKLEIPKGVLTAVMTSPVGLFAHPKTNEPMVLTAFRRTLRCAWSPQFEKDYLVVRPDQPVTVSSMFDYLGEVCAEEIQNEMEEDLKYVEGPMLYAFYTPPFIVGKDDDSSRSRPGFVYRYAKKA